jgi:histidine ammonia-lyase
MTTAAAITLGGDAALGVDDVVAVARGRRPVALEDGAHERMTAARELVAGIAAGDGKPVYGIDTGFGALGRVRIPHDDLVELQHNLLRSHAAGTGGPLEPEVARAMMLLLANSLAKGHSGVRPELVERIVALLNDDLTPVVPSRGSVGASGDLSPLAHLALGIVGEAELADGNRAGPLRLAPKEGLALVNGTHLMAGLGALLVHDMRLLLEASELTSALSLDVLLCSIAPMDDRIHALRRRPRQREVAARVRGLVAGSELNASHADCARVQDPYSIRCVPQVLGAAWEAFDYVAGAIALELDAVTDNPLCFPGDGAVLSGGNFHGQPLSLPLDTLALVAAEVAAFSERRTYRLLADDSDDPLPPFLTARPGTNSGLMLLQYVAAALVAENQVLATPAGTASLPTSAGQEDWNSLGATAALKARDVVANARKVVAIELLAAAQALDLRRPLRTTDELEALHARVRELSPVVGADRSLAPDVEAVAQAIADGRFGRDA